MSEALQPVGLKLAEQRQLQIEWSDGWIQRIPFRLLRSACPCATCREKAGGYAEDDSEGPVKAGASSMALPIVAPNEARPLTVVSMQPAGNYAYQIKFSDGHATGLFPFELLRSLGDSV
jgi:DUF971 family protein